MFSHAENLRFYGHNSFSVTAHHGESEHITKLLHNLDDDMTAGPR